ncbi:cytochrome P450 [Boletus coccyginus]|nr:cytochrome P450 [Boletus coccyginus]
MPLADVSLSSWTLLLVAAISAAVWVNRARKMACLPPGPKGSDVVSVTTLGHTTVILNSAQAVDDLFVVRGSNYSDRPDMPMLIDLWGRLGLDFRSNAIWPSMKEHRRIFHNHFDLTLKDHRRIQVPAAHELVRLLEQSPAKFLDHLEHYTARIIMKRVYGYHFEDSMTDPFVLVNKAASETTSTATVPGTFLVDTFPLLKYVPEWVPGAGFKKKAREWRALQEAVVNRPYNMVQEEMETVFRGCFWLTSSIVLGSDTTLLVSEKLSQNLATMTCFILAMVLHPNVQKRVHAELDSVLCGERLPTFQDKERLPYFMNVFREVLRWLVVSIPHRATNSDTYKGYYIPADATVVGNSWALLHDPDVYPEPESFYPERFEKGNVPDPVDYAAFGYGRRSCAGKNMALDTVWIAIATILSVFSIDAPVDENDAPVMPEITFRRSTINHPAPFDCTFKVRSTTAYGLIHQELDWDSVGI